MCGFISIILLIELDWKCMLLPGVNRAFLHLCWVGMTLNGFSMKTFLLLQIWCDFCAVGQKHQKKWAAGNYVAVLNKWKTHLQKNNKKLGAFVRLFTRGTMRYWFTYEKGKCTTLHVTCFTNYKEKHATNCCFNNTFIIFLHNKCCFVSKSSHKQ